MLLLDRVADSQARDWYATQAVGYGWSRSVLSHYIDTRRFERVGSAPDNFATALPSGEQDLVRQTLADPYDLEFLSIDPAHSERQLEDALVAKLSAFLVELGSGFAFVGRQHRLTVGGEDFFVDLLFFHLGLRRYVVFELKVDSARPEHVGKLGFYVTVVDDQLRRPENGDGPTIGILLAKDRNDIVVEYALRTIDAPVAVATYTTDRALPDDLRRALPSADDLAGLVGDFTEMDPS